MNKGFLRAGHWPTLLSAFLYFDVSFMVWVILGPLAPFAAEVLNLSPSEKGFLVALPLLAGSFFRPLLGALADRIGGRSTGLLGLTLTLLPLATAWKIEPAFGGLLIVGLMLGIAGASFAVALPLASRWYPPEYQGLALGIAGAGNSGTLLATLFAPRLASALGWQTVFGVALIPVLVVIVLFAWLAKDAPVARKRVTWKDYKALLGQADTIWFCLFYAVTFGGFVGFASFLTIFFVDQFGFARVKAGDLATLCVIAGSFIRPIGGWLSDRLGGYRLLLLVYLSVGAGLLILASSPNATVAVAVLVTTMAFLGMGNGAVFQLVPQRFGASVGLVTGIVGAAGGLGGFFLPSLLGVVRQATGYYAAGFGLCAGVAFLAAIALLLRGNVWVKTWDSHSAQRAGIFALAIQTPESSGLLRGER